MNNIKEIKKGNPIFSNNEIRNICWNCENYFNLNLPVLPHEIGQKKYFTCNYCHKINHI